MTSFKTYLWDRPLYLRFRITFCHRLITFRTSRVQSNRRVRNGWLQLLIFVSVSEIPDAVIANIPAGLSGACINAALIENRNSVIFSRPTLGIWLKSLRLFVHALSEHTNFLSFTARKIVWRNNGRRRRNISHC